MAFEFIEKLLGLLDVYPAQPPQPLPDVDARTQGLLVLREFISRLTFYREGERPDGNPIPFKIRLENIHVEQPDNVVEMKFPSVVFIPQRGIHIPYGIGPAAILDDTLDLYGPGSALALYSEYEETFTVEVWGSKIPERRAVMAGLQQVFQTGADTTTLRLKMVDFFNLPACFELMGSQYIDEADAVRGRRRAQLFVRMGVVEAALFNAKTLQPYVATVVQDTIAVDEA